MLLISGVSSCHVTNTYCAVQICPFSCDRRSPYHPQRHPPALHKSLRARSNCAASFYNQLSLVFLAHTAAMALRLLATVLLLGLVTQQVQHACADPTAAPTTPGDTPIPPLPHIQRLPDGCGAVGQVIDGPLGTCSAFA